MCDPIVRFVQADLERFQAVRELQPTLFPNQDNLYPIPFFGDIRRAEVLTLGLNPACTEFSQGGAKERYWLPNNHLPAAAAPPLTMRLLHYFDLPVPVQHRWFDECEKALLYLACSYETNAAHVDLHSLPTKFWYQLGEEDRNFLRNRICERSSLDLQEVLAFAPRVRLIIIVDFAVPVVGGGHASTLDFVLNHMPFLADRVVEGGAKPPILSGGGHGQIANLIFRQRKPLRQYLQRPPK
jgi:hypothetical protein